MKYAYVVALVLSFTLACGGETYPERAIRIDKEGNDEGCRCFFDDLGYASVEACQSDPTGQPSDHVTACANEAYASNAAAIGAQFECQTDAREDFVECFRSADCGEEAVTACEEAEGAALDDCPVSDDADIAAYLALFDACLSERVGPPEAACPDTTVMTGTSTLDTTGRGDDSQSEECGGEGAADVSVAFTASAAGTYRFSTAGTAFDTVLYVRGSCDGGELACSDDGDIDRTSQLELELEAGQSVVVFVDGFDSTQLGSAVLEITAL